MFPTIHIGDHIVVDLTAYMSTAPHRGEVIVFTYPEDPSKDFVKRVIGLPGETIEIKQKKVLINGHPLTEDWGMFERSNANEAGDNLNPMVVPAAKYFMMGDNRDRSYDSRFWGAVSAPAIKGKALYIYWARDKSRIGRRFH